ncbi:Protein of unknown function (DUF2958) [Mesorhizobium sp. J18]|nr:Protein of unknown function (DUF2958) [Mesorhizobium sp. J18]
MRLITDKHLEVLLENGRKAARNPDFDPYPVVKLFTPDANATWLIAEADPEDPDILYGLCDLGLGFAEPGSVRLSEILEVAARSDCPWNATFILPPTGRFPNMPALPLQLVPSSCDVRQGRRRHSCRR